MESRIAERDRSSKDMGAQIAKLSEEKEQLEQQLEERQSSITALKGDTADQEERLKAEFKQLEQSRQELQKQADTDIKRLETELGELRREKTALESRAGDTGRRTLRYSVLRQGSRIWNPG
jgi:DNA repair exonuclease SbcCD ATPase subunit